MITEITEDKIYIIWNDTSPEALVVSNGYNHITFTQQNDIVEISKERIKELVKVLTRLGKTPYK
jgi:hypothetical protein